MESIRLVGTVAGRRRIITIRKDESVVGSAPGADFVLDDPSVAARHARIVRSGDSYQLSALADTLETRINGQRITVPTILRSGDQVRFGATSFVIEELADSSVVRPQITEKPIPSRRSKPRHYVRLIAFGSVIAVLAFGAVLALINWDQIETVADRDHAGLNEAASTADQRSQANRDKPSTGMPTRAGSGPVAVAKPDAAPWLIKLNYYRSLVGLGSVDEDPNLSAENLLHARYIVKNYSSAIKANNLGAEAHTEEVGNPWYTPAGATAARNSDVEEEYFPEGVPVTFSPTATVDGLITVPFHRLTILNPSLTRAGYAQFCENGVCVGALDIGSSVDKLPDKPAPLSTPIMFPPNGSKLALRSFDGEWPSPLTACAGFSLPAGLPLTLQLGSFVDTKLSGYSLSREGSSATPLEVCAFDATSYINPKGNELERARTILRARGAVVLIPRYPLQPGRYTVSITVDREYKWSFTIE